MIYDLHVHTTDSDGKYTRLELLKRAEDKKIKYLSFTDHDYISNIDIKREYEELYGKSSVKIINGIEFTVEDYEQMHILCYDLKHTLKIEKKLKEIYEYNANLCLRLIKKLRDYYKFDLNIDEYPNYAISKGLIRRMIVDKGYANTPYNAGILYTGKNSKFYEKSRFLELKEILRVIKEGNGLAFLAHPSTLKLDDYSLDKLIKKLVNNGLDGIEVLNTSKTTHLQEKYYSYLAKKYNILTSCGSDYHDERQTFGVENNKSDKLIKLLKER
ncbi:MAG: PHP domain-containing protein [Bacilli bacterium]|nr:PHP domain-containing protein [Bacilli bacterium]